MANFLIYGANGYTGELITRLAARKGLKPILAGRNAAKVEELLFPGESGSGNVIPLKPPVRPAS